MKARSRNTDPSSSHSAARRTNVHITAQAAEVLSLVGVRPQTASQIEQRAAKRDINLDRYAISRRMPDLETAGAVKRMGHARCPIRKVPMLLWALA